MLRVGLTGGLGSGKSTAARLFAAQGAHVFEADEIGRELMQPGQAVYDAIVAAFGPGGFASGGCWIGACWRGSRLVTGASRS